MRDPNTGLYVPEAGCYTFTGDHALAYVRSRKLEYLDVDGEWRRDPTSDLGRISRQQDFLKRTVQRLLDKGAYDPDVAGGLIQTLSEYIVTDQQLTPRKMLEFAGVLSGVDPTGITTYQIEADPRTIQGNAVLVPNIDGDNMGAILAVFRGQATLGAIPEQVFETTVPTTGAPTDTLAPTTTLAPGEVAPATTLPQVIANENNFGVVPDKNISC